MIKWPVKRIFVFVLVLVLHCSLLIMRIAGCSGNNQASPLLNSDFSNHHLIRMKLCTYAPPNSHKVISYKWSFVAVSLTLLAINNFWQVENIWQKKFGDQKFCVVNVFVEKRLRARPLDLTTWTTTIHIIYFAMLLFRAFRVLCARDWCCSDSFIELEATTRVTNFSSYTVRVFRRVFVRRISSCSASQLTN